MTTPKIDVKGVHKRFGPKVVLDGLDQIGRASCRERV